MNNDFSKARRRLSRRDPVMKELIRRIGKCTLRSDANGFCVLVRAIISQQISSKAAVSIGDRLQQRLGRKRLNAKNLLSMPEDDLRAVGLSASKARSVLDLAARTHAKEIPFAEMNDMSDEEVMAHLLPVKGIGPWTAEMFLIFSLGRMDVLPCADYGLRAGVQNQYKLEELPNVGDLTAIGEAWRPFRSIGTWYIWRSFGDVPQS